MRTEEESKSYLLDLISGGQIDKKMEDLCIEINQLKGYSTSFCCSGHWQEETETNYVSGYIIILASSIPKDLHVDNLFSLGGFISVGLEKIDPAKYLYPVEEEFLENNGWNIKDMPYKIEFRWDPEKIDQALASIRKWVSSGLVREKD